MKNINIFFYNKKNHEKYLICLLGRLETGVMSFYYSSISHQNKNSGKEK